MRRRPGHDRIVPGLVSAGVEGRIEFALRSIS
jgi:hypothetical protein